MGLFGGEARDRAKVLAAVPPAGATSVDRLAAELRWPRDRAVRALEKLSSGSSGIRYDPASGSVGFAGVTPVAAAPRTAPAEPVEAPAPTLPLRPGVCPDCRTPLSPAGTPGTFYCPSCGTLEARAGATVPPTRPSPTSPAPAGKMATDRRTQELFAAWLTSSSIPCPRCRQPLAHRGVESYACPACGETVKFTDEGATAVDPPNA